MVSKKVKKKAVDWIEYHAMVASETYVEEGDHNYEGDPNEKKDRILEMAAITYIKQLILKDGKSGTTN